MAASGPVLGIDFGTSNSGAAYLRDGKLQLVEMALGQMTMPTTFFFDFDTRKTLIGEKVLDIRRAEREAMVDPDGISNDFTRETIAFQAQHGGWYIHTQRLTKCRTANKLAIPCQMLSISV